MNFKNYNSYLRTRNKRIRNCLKENFHIFWIIKARKRQKRDNVTVVYSIYNTNINVVGISIEIHYNGVLLGNII